MSDRIRVSIPGAGFPRLLKEIISRSLEKQQNIDVVESDERIEGVHIVVADRGEADTVARELYRRSAVRLLIALAEDGRSARIFPSDGTPHSVDDLSIEELAAIIRKLA